MATDSQNQPPEDTDRPVLIPVRDGVWRIPDDNRPVRIFNEHGVEIQTTTSSQIDKLLIEGTDGKSLPEVISDAWNNNKLVRLFTKWMDR